MYRAFLSTPNFFVLYPPVLHSARLGGHEPDPTPLISGFHFLRFLDTFPSRSPFESGSDHNVSATLKTSAVHFFQILILLKRSKACQQLLKLSHRSCSILSRASEMFRESHFPAYKHNLTFRRRKKRISWTAFTATWSRSAQLNAIRFYQSSSHIYYCTLHRSNAEERRKGRG